MNINLLPNKYIRNRAFELIFFVAMITTLFLLTLFGLGFWYYHVQSNRLESSIMSEQAERIVFQRQLEYRLASKSEELQQVIGEQKQHKFYTAPVMEAFEEVTDRLGVTIISYNLFLNSDEDVSERAQDGTLLFPSISMVVQGNIYHSLIQIKTAFEEIPWVHHTTYQVLTHRSDVPEGQVTLYLSQADTPNIGSAESEEGHND